MRKRERLTSKMASSKNSPQQDARELDGFVYDKSKAKVLKKSLHNLNVSLGAILNASREISMIRGSEITPDGKLGGKGFIMSFKDIKKKLNETINNLSDITDTISDELTNPGWGLSQKEKKKVKKDNEKIDEIADEVEDSLEESVKEDSEKSMPNTDAKTEVEDTDSIEEETVKEASDNQKYRTLIASDDLVAGALGKRILANLLTGEE